MSTEQLEDEHNFEEEYTKRTAIRTVAVILVFLVLSNLAFAGLFAWQFIKKTRVEYVLLQLEDSSNLVYRIQQSNTLETDKATLLRESMLRSYVVNRLTVNHIDEEDRYKKVKLMSSAEEWEKFDSQMNPEKNPKSPLINEKYQSKIRILRPPVLVTTTGYQIDFEQTETKLGEDLPPTRWSAYIQFSYKPLNVEYQDRYINIDGITVERFSIRQEF